MKRDTVLFWMCFVVLFLLIANIYGSIFNYFIPFNTATSILSLLLLIVGVVPLSAILADKVSKYALDKGLKETKNFRRFMVGLTVFVVVAVSMTAFNHYREKDLDQAIRYTAIDFDFMGFTQDWNNVPEGHGYEWVTNDKETVEELMEFLSQYRVKVQEIDGISGNHHFEFTINHKLSNSTMVWVLNGTDVRIGEDVYEVVNGPIDMEWIKEFNESIRKIR
ncbi:hypothetical protein [Ornithinibacillus californiensis]|uniref:hypothetical protein n=1 Tax=Ornithinibacillus californiensis TaxID=161536 RepID=UPI00064DB825|nr:hypothetical protein [Ornithinibacillus californiensis]